MDIFANYDSLKKNVEENYVSNREKIIRTLYDITCKDIDIANDNTTFLFQDDKQKLQNIVSRLKKIQQMVENGDDENDVLAELEISDGEMYFLKKYAKLRGYGKLRERQL